MLATVNSVSIASFPWYSGDFYDKSREKDVEDASDKKFKRPDDRIGVISFADNAWIDAIPGNQLVVNAKPIHGKRGGGTDIGGALQLALATFRNDAMRRIVLVSDGNQNLGD